MGLKHLLGCIALGACGALAHAQNATPLQRARAWALSAHYDSSLAVYDSVLAHEPHNWDAALGRAQTIAWTGRLADAEAIYRHLVGAGAGPDAQKGLARVLAWRGHLDESERLYRVVVSHDSTDTEALTGLAQVLVWENRPRDAKAAIDQGLHAHPDDDDARTMAALVRPLVDPSVRPTLTVSGDNEHNTSVGGAIAGDALAPWDGRVLLDAGYHNASGLAVHGQSMSAQLGARFEGPVAVRIEGGAAETQAVARTVATGVGAFHATVALGPLTVTAGVWRAPFDETATLIAHGIVQNAADGNAELRLPGGMHADVIGSYTTLAGGSRVNERIDRSAYLWTGSWHGLSLGAGSHGYGYLRPDSTDGYFAPASFVLAEGVVRATIVRDRGINAALEVGAGAQRIAAFTQPSSTKAAERVSGTLTYRVAPGIEWGLTGGYAIAASPYATSEGAAVGYRGYSAGLVVRFIP